MEGRIFFYFIITTLLFNIAQASDKNVDPQKVYDSVVSQYRPLHCCTSNLKNCVEASASCPLLKRLSSFALWLSQQGKEREKILEYMAERERSLTSSERFPIDVYNLPFAGAYDAKVTIVMYISASCPLCKLLVGEIYNEVTNGELISKAKLVVKPYTRGFGDKCLLAAAQAGKFWDYLLLLAKFNQRLDREVLLAAAEQIGLPRDEFEKMATNPQLEATLEKSHEEGVKNGVTITPTIFINGRRYKSYKHTIWLIDAADYEYEMLIAKMGKKKEK